MVVAKISELENKLLMSEKEKEVVEAELRQVQNTVTRFTTSAEHGYTLYAAHSANIALCCFTTSMYIQS